jgi:hypothetical protein
MFPPLTIAARSSSPPIACASPSSRPSPPTSNTTHDGPCRSIRGEKSRAIEMMACGARGDRRQAYNPLLAPRSSLLENLPAVARSAEAGGAEAQSATAAANVSRTDTSSIGGVRSS